MTEVQLNYHVPSRDLAPYVTAFYHFRVDAPLFDDAERASNAQLRFRLSPGPARYFFPDGSAPDAPPFHILSATDGVRRVRVEGPVRVFGLGLTPAGWHALMGADASSMVNQVLDAELLFGDFILYASVKLRNARDAADMAATFEPVLRDMLAADRDPATLAFVGQVDAWLTGSPSPDIAELVACAGLSRRQVERRCKALYGFPPKLLARKYRALRAAVALATGDAALADIVDGFYDQSHMIREIKQFTGATPREMRDRPSLLARMTIARRRALGSKVGPLVSDT